MGVLSFDNNFTADSDGDPWNVPVSNKYLFYAVGDFGGGCLSLESLPNGSGNDWFTVDQLTKPGRLIRYLVNGERVRLRLTGSTNPDVNAGIRQ
jgi:hypothetical protein